MDEYLDEEMDYVKESMDVICKNWDEKVSVSPPFFRLTNFFPNSMRLPPASNGFHRSSQ